MAFLILDGDLTLEVTQIEESEPELIGDESRSDSGSLRGAITAEKRVWSLTLNEMTETEYQTLRSRCAFGAQLPITGTGLPNITVRCRITSAPFVRTGTGPTDLLRVVNLAMVEV